MDVPVDRASWRAWPTRAGAIAVAVATLALMLATRPAWRSSGTRATRSGARRASGPGSGPSATRRGSPRPGGRRPSSSSRPTARRRRPPTEIDTRAELLAPAVPCTGSGRSPARSRTATPRSTRSSAWSATCSPPAGRPCRAPGSGRCSPSAWSPGPCAFAGPAVRAPGPPRSAAGAWVLQPQLFAHGHYATTDGPLASLWVGAILAFAEAAIPARHGDRREATPALGMGRRLRRPGRLGGRHEADRLVPAGPVPGLDGPLPEPPGGVDPGRRRAWWPS